MRIKDKVRETDPVAYSVIRNAKKFAKFSHAYLIEATQKEDTSNAALFLLQSIVCEQKGVLVCDECLSCKKIIKGTYPDLQVLDGSQGLIKKEMVVKAVDALAQTPLEKTAKRILYIKNIESSNKHSINSFLKFIEEPSRDTFIVITTNAISKVLSTIISRVQLIKLKPKQIKTLSNQLLDKGVLPKFAPLLAAIYPSVNIAIEGYESNFLDIHNLVGNFVSKLALNKHKASITFINDFSKKDGYKIYIEILQQLFNDIWRFNMGQPINCIKFEESISLLAENQYNFVKSIEAIWEFKHAIQYNANFDLAKEKLLIELVGKYGK